VHGNHVVFQIEVTPSDGDDEVDSQKESQGKPNVPDERSWVVLKRFSEFVLLDEMLNVDRAVKRLKSLVPSAVLPPLPQKELKLLVSHLETPFVEKRRVLLELYLQELIGIPCVRCCETLLQFLGVRDS